MQNNVKQKEDNLKQAYINLHLQTLKFVEDIILNFKVHTFFKKFKT